MREEEEEEDVRATSRVFVALIGMYKVTVTVSLLRRKLGERLKTRAERFSTPRRARSGLFVRSPPRKLSQLLAAPADPSLRFAFHSLLFLVPTSAAHPGSRSLPPALPRAHAACCALSAARALYKLV